MIETTAPGINRPTVSLGLIGLLTFVVGYLGQGSLGVGARAAPSAVSVVVTDVFGGAGNRRPVRVQLTLAIANQGTDEVQVLGPLTVGTGTRVLAMSPAVLLVKPDTIGEVTADVTLECDSPRPLQLANLQLQMVDGIRRSVEIGGTGKVLEACSRAVLEVRPLTVELSPTTAPRPPPSATPTPSPATTDRRLPVVLQSPTGRRIDVTEIRSGGVPLLTPAKPLTVVGSAPVDVLLNAPPNCPMQWRVNGIPSSLTVDLAPGADAGATLTLRIGPRLTTWLLATACPRLR